MNKLQSIFREYSSIFSKAIISIKLSNKNIPIIGKYIFRLTEYFKYIFKYKKYLKENYKYKDIHKGKRCFIIGNGPSLSKMDLRPLKNEFTITVNSMTSTEEFDLIRPKYHVVVDYARFDKKVPSLTKHLEALAQLEHKPKYVFPVKYKKYIEKNNFHKGIDIIYLDPLPRISRIFDIDFTKRIPYYANVNNVTISLAIYLGFSEIYLIGCDMTGIVKVYDENEDFSTGGHFYSNSVDESERNYITQLQECRSNETFLSTYYQTFRIFRFLNDYAKAKNVKIFNATKGGTLDVFPRVKYEDLFNS